MYDGVSEYLGSMIEGKSSFGKVCEFVIDLECSIMHLDL